ncbi:hypothetical protein, partial [Pseudomonas aeruginosa]|uniref:hypothetical protein n=1 Tax=Pseudomonas aeruginosa TaxID=287 RepID=UPI00259C9434
FRKEYAELAAQVAQPLQGLNDFTALESTLEDTQRQARSAREQIRTLGKFNWHRRSGRRNRGRPTGTHFGLAQPERQRRSR